MKRTYYIKSKIYQSDCLEKALGKALNILQSDNETTSIVILVPTVSQFSLLEGIFTKENIKNRGWHIDELNKGIRFETVKTYNPYAFQRHVLLTLCVSAKDFIKFEDDCEAYYWIVVPQMCLEMESWLKVHSAIDVDTNKIIEHDFPVDEQIANAIGWLRATSYPNEGFNHPSDMNRLKSIANAVATCGFVVDYDAVLHYCINHGINHDGGRKIAECFVKAQDRKFKTDGNYPFDFLKKMMNK